MNTEDFVTYQQAVKLKELGFSEAVNHYYVDGFDTVRFNPNYFDYSKSENLISAPTIWETWKWLRVEKDLYVEPQFMKMDAYTYEILSSHGLHKIDFTVYNSPEEAISEGITECLGLL